MIPHAIAISHACTALLAELRTLNASQALSATLQSSSPSFPLSLTNSPVWYSFSVSGFPTIRTADPWPTFVLLLYGQSAAGIFIAHPYTPSDPRNVPTGLLSANGLFTASALTGPYTDVTSGGCELPVDCAAGLMLLRSAAGELSAVHHDVSLESIATLP